MLKSSDSEKDLGITMNKQFNMSYQSHAVIKGADMVLDV